MQPFKEKEKLICQESVYITSVTFSGLLLEERDIWVYLRFKLNNLLLLGVNFMYILTNCSIYWNTWDRSTTF